MSVIHCFAPAPSGAFFIASFRDLRILTPTEAGRYTITAEPYALKITGATKETLIRYIKELTDAGIIIYASGRVEYMGEVEADDYRTSRRSWPLHLERAIDEHVKQPSASHRQCGK